jgi:hypothetical protein
MRGEVCVTHLCHKVRLSLDKLISTRKELAERYFSVFIFIEDGDHSFYKRVLVELRDIKNLIRV